MEIREQAQIVEVADAILDKLEERLLIINGDGTYSPEAYSPPDVNCFCRLWLASSLPRHEGPDDRVYEGEVMKMTLAGVLFKRWIGHRSLLRNMEELSDQEINDDKNYNYSFIPWVRVEEIEYLNTKSQ